jgi:ParB family transcriptional regulator, chromosome partitioning protein
MVTKYKSTLGDIIKNNFKEIDKEIEVTERNKNKIFLAASAGKRKQVSILSVDPKRCKLWKYHNRIQEYLTEISCADIIESMKVRGQEQPAIAREIKGNPEYDFEIIYGSRRRFSCAYLGRDLDIILTDEDDKTCAARMDIENRAREDISDYERARDYKKWLENGLFSTAVDLAKHIGITKAYVSNFLKLTALPKQVIAAFTSPLDIKPYHAIEIMRVLDQPQFKEKVLRKARELYNQKLDAKRVCKILVAVAQVKAVESSNEEIEMKHHFTKGLLVIKINKKLSKEKVNDIKTKLVEII